MDYLTTHTSISQIRREFAPVFVDYKKVAFDKVYQLLAHGRWLYPGTPASSTTTTGRHDKAAILLKVALSTINQIKLKCINYIAAGLIPMLFFFVMVCVVCFAVFVFVLCNQCYQYLWIVQYILPLRFSLTFILHYFIEIVLCILPKRTT